MSYTPRYLATLKYDPANRPKGLRGTKPTVEIWGNDDSMLQADKRYAWMKHKAQAKYRGEEHSLTLDEWLTLWTDERFLQRGKHKDALCLSKKQIADGWHLNNVEIVPRSEHLKRAKEYRAHKNGQ